MASPFFLSCSLRVESVQRSEQRGWRAPALQPPLHTAGPVQYSLKTAPHGQMKMMHRLIRLDRTNFLRCSRKVCDRFTGLYLFPRCYNIIYCNVVQYTRHHIIMCCAQFPGLFAVRTLVGFALPGPLLPRSLQRVLPREWKGGGNVGGGGGGGGRTLGSPVVPFFIFFVWFWFPCVLGYEVHVCSSVYALNIFKRPFPAASKALSLNCWGCSLRPRVLSRDYSAP